MKRPPTELSEGNLSASTDLLGSILDGQSLLTTNSRDIQISREGMCINVLLTIAIDIEGTTRVYYSLAQIVSGAKVQIAKSDPMNTTLCIRNNTEKIY